MQSPGWPRTQDGCSCTLSSSLTIGLAVSSLTGLCLLERCRLHDHDIDGHKAFADF